MGDVNREPSMEEILASIKRVIAEDGRGVGQPRSARRPQPSAESSPQPAAPADQEVLELSDPVSDENGLLSEGATAASRQSLAALAAMRNGGGMEASPSTPSDGPLAAVVREMLKPILKEWLDQRLPDMVEELVTREIARITGKHL